MQLKNYQQQALEQLDRWLDALKESQNDMATAKSVYAKMGKSIPEELKNYPHSAWQSMTKQKALPAVTQDGKTAVPAYITRPAASGQPIPHVCLKVPTGGGKTLLGIAALERVKRDSGFVLWIVPTRAIYEQTIKSFRTREHPYRQRLERMSGGRVKLLEKTDRFTKQDTENYLCIMMLMLPSVNRQQKDFLKIFRDSSGYMSFFPEQDDVRANQQLAQQYPDLDKSGDCVKQSMFNVLKLIRPTVILDEAHKAYGKSDTGNKEFVKAINRLNPRLMIELSATPKINISNILVNISGNELRQEEMIKLPIKIHSFSNSDWQQTLAQTQIKLHHLGQEAARLQAAANRYIRPMALVRVQRTGKNQRSPKHVHSEDVREYLIQNLAVPENQIKVQSSEQKELAGEDLLSEMCAVRWIITKDALKEGWDCSFAYVLALLDNTTAITAMTQMVGRVMRQPHAHREQQEALNQCYIYCYNQDVGKAVDGIKAGLENEGLTGLGDSVCEHDAGAPEKRTVARRQEYKELNIFLPQVLHKKGRTWRPLDYERDILGAVDWAAIDVGKAVNLDDDNVVQEVKTTVDIQGQGEVSEVAFDSKEELTLDYFVRRLIDAVPNPWQAARMAENFIKKHKKYGNKKLLNNRIYLAEKLLCRVKGAIDGKAESVFRDKVKQNEIRFHLETDEGLDYALNKSFEVSVASKPRTLQGTHGEPLQWNLFEPVYESDFNGLEEDFALYLENSKAIYWWHRIAARQEYSLQGWRRHRVYPDFVACQKGNGKLLILETKGAHLQGNEDTKYKKKLLETLETTYSTAHDCGKMEVKEPAPAAFRMMFADDWKEKINEILG